MPYREQKGESEYRESSQEWEMDVEESPAASCVSDFSRSLSETGKSLDIPQLAHGFESLHSVPKRPLRPRRLAAPLRGARRRAMPFESIAGLR